MTNSDAEEFLGICQSLGIKVAFNDNMTSAEWWTLEDVKSLAKQIEESRPECLRGYRRKAQEYYNEASRAIWAANDLLTLLEYHCTPEERVGIARAINSFQNEALGAVAMAWEASGRSDYYVYMLIKHPKQSH